MALCRIPVFHYEKNDIEDIKTYQLIINKQYNLDNSSLFLI
jgi:hypothetical protein